MKHLCHAMGCPAPVPPRMLMCRAHWFMVPRTIRAQVWRTYRPGQEQDKNPTAEYLLAARDAINSVGLVEGRITLEQASVLRHRLAERLGLA